MVAVWARSIDCIDLRTRPIRSSASTRPIRRGLATRYALMLDSDVPIYPCRGEYVELVPAKRGLATGSSTRSRTRTGWACT